MKRLMIVAAMLGLGLLAVNAVQALPVPEPNFAATLTPRACNATNSYEESLFASEGWTASDGYTRYGQDCQRLQFTYGPIAIKPGQNDIFIAPVTIEKPTYDGYIVRFEPNLVRADGSIPPIEQIHLHHATWLNLASNYGDEIWPFFASGEEKTIFDLPRRYGLPVFATDTWQLNYMIHNQTPRPDAVWITYNVDVIPKTAAEQDHQLKPAYPIWLDVRPSFYPVFNVQRKYGHLDAEGRVVCTWPKEKCADFDPWGKTLVGQGQNGNGTGRVWQLPSAGQSLGRINDFRGGTLISIGGHVHPGGLSVDVDLERTGAGRTRIFTSEANYWSWTDPGVVGGPPTSWDMSMTVASLPRWGVEVLPGDKLWINATYEAQIQSTFENMGIAMAWLAPHGATSAGPGVNAFTAPKDTSDGCQSGGLLASPQTLCDKGLVTHGHMEEASNHGGPSGSLAGGQGPSISQITIANFNYVPATQGLAPTIGIPSVPLGSNLRFLNADAVADILHSVTSCAFPCTGATGIAFPLGDGRSSSGGTVDFDSGELGYGPQFSFQGDYFTAAKNTQIWDLPVTSANGFETGSTYSFFCRVHPSMRGAFSVR